MKTQLFCLWQWFKFQKSIIIYYNFEGCRAPLPCPVKALLRYHVRHHTMRVTHSIYDLLICFIGPGSYMISQSYRALNHRAGAPADAAPWIAKCPAREWRVGAVNADSKWRTVMSRRAGRGMIENIHSIFGTWIFKIIYLACASRHLTKLLFHGALWRNSLPCLRVQLVQVPPLARHTAVPKGVDSLSPGGSDLPPASDDLPPQGWPGFLVTASGKDTQISRGY